MHSEEEGKYQESIQSNTTPEPGHHIGKRKKYQYKLTKTKQEVSMHVCLLVKASL